MNYDYGSGSQKLEMPNPYRVQNMLLFLCAGILFCAGLWALWMAHEHLQVVPIVLGVALILGSCTTAATAAQRLRFFFGRGRPHSLSEDLQPTDAKSPKSADYFKFLLREGALVYPEPSGAIAGILYNWAPHLITAPAEVQQQARIAFFNLAALAVTLLSFLVSWGLFGSDITRPWLSLGYFIFGVGFMLRPIVRSSRAQLGIGSLVILITTAILAPAVVNLAASRLDHVPEWTLAPQAIVLFVASLLAVGLAFFGILKQIQPPPQTQTSAHQQSLSINVAPTLLLEELERHMQSRWVERIPNRRYARQVPTIDPNQSSGSFAGELFEEAQPIPLAGSVPPDLAQALGSTRHRWLAMLDVYATTLLVIAVTITLVFASAAAEATDLRELSFRQVGTSSILFAVSAFCFHTSSRLWGRFDFESVLTWVEMSGSYQIATMGTGNAFSRSHVQTGNRVVRIESMTLRVWRARIESVVFGKDSRRQIIAMFSTDSEAQALASHLVEFGQSRASIVAPVSEADLRQIGTLAAADQAMARGVATPPAPPLAAAPASTQLGAGAAPPAQATHAHASACSKCGASLMASARFCMQCGDPVPST